MKSVGRVIFGLWLAFGGLVAVSPPAEAGTDIGISFGWFGPGYVPFGDSCAYYDYFDAPPPWGLPPDYCDYPVYFGTVFWNGIWYRGPIYYRWYGGERLFWLNGGWHRDGWRGGRPPQIQWRDRGGIGGFERGRDWNRSSFDRRVESRSKIESKKPLTGNREWDEARGRNGSDKQNAAGTRPATARHANDSVDSGDLVSGARQGKNSRVVIPRADNKDKFSAGRANRDDFGRGQGDFGGGFGREDRGGGSLGRSGGR